MYAAPRLCRSDTDRCLILALRPALSSSVIMNCGHVSVCAGLTNIPLLQAFPIPQLRSQTSGCRNCLCCSQQNQEVCVIYRFCASFACLCIAMANCSLGSHCLQQNSHLYYVACLQGGLCSIMLWVLTPTTLLGTLRDENL